MTNTQQITMNHIDRTRGPYPMHGWTEASQVVIRARIRERELEAASERLAAGARIATTPSSLRRTVGRLLIRTGRRIAGESALAGSPVARPARPMAA
jgi:plasmid stabilization system protein ParE